MVEELYKIKKTALAVKSDKLERCFDAVDEVFNGKKTGNKILGSECSWCVTCKGTKDSFLRAYKRGG